MVGVVGEEVKWRGEEKGLREIGFKRRRGGE